MRINTITARLIQNTTKKNSFLLEWSTKTSNSNDLLSLKYWLISNIFSLYYQVLVIKIFLF